MTAEQLADLDALYAAMTPGKVIAVHVTELDNPNDPGLYYFGIDGVHREKGSCPDATADLMDSDENPNCHANAAGFVALHNAYPGLSATIKALRVETVSVHAQLADTMEVAQGSASRLAKAEELLRGILADINDDPSPKDECQWHAKEKPRPECVWCHAAAFLAESTTA